MKHHSQELLKVLNMRYKNTKTGAIIDSPFKITGDNWEEYIFNPKVEEMYEELMEDIDSIENTLDLNELRKDELIEFAKEQSIEINEKDKKEVIIEVIKTYLQENEITEIEK